jgi:heme/copper-type cytochrome/quinol oxidase subunit 1
MMDPFVRRFIRSSLLWLGAGVLIGLSMAFWPMQAMVYRPAHVHANLLGFVSMMIFGVAYHVIPRFTGNPLRSRRSANAHVWVANAGLALLVGGWILRVQWPGLGGGAVMTGAVLSAIGAFLFITNVWRTLDPAPLRGMALPQVKPATPQNGQMQRSKVAKERSGAESAAPA